MSASPDPIPDLDESPALELADLLNTILDKGVALKGDITLAVADIDLVKLNLGLLLSAIETISSPAEDEETPQGAERGASTAALRSRSAVEAPRSAPVSAKTPPPHHPALARALGPIARPTPQAPPEPPVAQGLPDRINTDPQRVESGLARLVLTLIEVLRKVLEHQAVRRMDGGKLSAHEIERLGLALSKLNDRMQDLKRIFDLTDDDLQIDLGPLGRLR